MKNSHIGEMRAFNRYYTAVIGVLNKKFLNGKYSLPELRVLQAIHMQEGIKASEMIALLNIDKSYLSRILLQFEKKKLVSKKVCSDDGRAFHLYLTAAGKKDFEVQDTASHNQAKQILLKLTDKECETLIDCMGQIKNILTKSANEK